MTDETATRAFVRRKTRRLGPPKVAVGVIGWARANLFNSWFNAILTLVCAYLICAIGWPAIRFLLIDAVWDGASRVDCLEETVKRPVGACWPFIQAKFGQLVYGFYPYDERWRVNIVFALGAALLLPLMIPRVPYKALNAVLFFAAFPVVAFFLLVGGRLDSFVLGAIARGINSLINGIGGLGGVPYVGRVFAGLALLLDYATYPVRATIGFVTGQPYGLWKDIAASAVLTALIAAFVRRRLAPLRAILWTIGTFVAIAAVLKLLGVDEGRLEYVETRSWGGLLVTLVVAVTGIVVSLPLGILLALGRRSEMPVVRLLSISFIEFWRGVPLITVLFFATYMLPLFLPNNWTIDALLRALVGVALFASAYMAEVVRGGLQAIPKGQYEGAMALGLGYWKVTGLIVLPQALKLVIPGIVNTFIGLFKDTTLVLIVSILDLLGVLRATFADPNWSTPVTLFTGFAFTGFIYFAFCFGMSRYSLFVERRLSTGYRR